MRTKTKIKKFNNLAKRVRKHLKEKPKEIKDPVVTYIRNTHALKLLKLKAQYSKHVCIFIGKKLTEKEKALFFKKTIDEDMGCIYLHYRTDPMWSAILRDLGIAKSISDAKGAGWHKKVEFGFQDIFLDRMKDITKFSNYHNPKGYWPHRITILKEGKDDKPL